MYEFYAGQVRADLVNWIKDFFAVNGVGCNAIVGISGGIDSAVVAALCKEALGADRVIGILLPQNVQDDIDDAIGVCKHLGIRYITSNIGSVVDGIYLSMAFSNHSDKSVDMNDVGFSSQTKINLPARIRMAVLYAYSQSLNGRVANTSNLSETYVGYDTRWGDSVGDFSPLASLTKSEIREIAWTELHLPAFIVYKEPADGLCGMDDEDNFGFTYDVLDHYIRTGECFDTDVKEKIDTLQRRNKFKTLPIPRFETI